MMLAGDAPLTLYVVACGAAKTEHPARARDLYTGHHFRYVLAGAEREAVADTAVTGTDSAVAILSARHGLVDPDTVIAPYDQRMTDPGAVSVEVLAEQFRAYTRTHRVEVYALLPRAYYLALRQAADLLNDDDTTGLDYLVLVHDVHEAAPGIGHQRRVIACMA